MIVCEQWVGGVPWGAGGARPYLTGQCCPLHTPAALAGRPEPHGQYPEPFPNAQTFRFRQNDTALIDDRARKSGKRASGVLRRASHAS